ncbi:MAG: hydroxymethylglutaryl-CoA reductase, partial [Yaniella sp.]
MIDPTVIEPSKSTYQDTFTTAVPTRWVGPLRMSGAAFDGVEELDVPLATYETPLWPSVGRGAKISRMLTSGITATVHDERMTRSVLFNATDASAAQTAADTIQARFDELADVVRQGSRYAQLLEIHPEIVGNLLFLRFAYLTGDASGHNMATAASDSLMSTILSWNIGLSYGSISGNFCT